ncbi:MAG: hypothetical protein ACI8WB_002910 [Phenylobacterium sp.]|jgi:hypothetical protein
MSVAQIVDCYINRQHFGKVFTFEQFMNRTKLELGRKKAATAAFSRKVKEGEIKRIAKSTYYRPKKSKFGYLPVDTNDLIRTISRDKKSAYVVAGAGALNALGLSTQLPMVRSYIVSERVRVQFKALNIKLEYKETLSYFSAHLRVKDKTQRQIAFLFWSALAYIEKIHFQEYKIKLLALFRKLLCAPVQHKFIKALPPSMIWAADELIGAQS